MSSSACRDWSLELKPPGVAIALLGTWLLLLLLVVWQSAVPPVGFLGGLLAVLILGVPPVCSQLSGLFPSALKRISWSADGTWRLRDGAGREWSAELLPQSKIMPRCALLLWRHGGKRSWALVTLGDGNRDPFRRLCVRLRWTDSASARHTSAGTPARPAGAC